MNKIAVFFASMLLLITLVSADFKVEIKHNEFGKRIDCTLGETTCFDYFFQKCMRDSIGNIMLNTIDTCRPNEACDNTKGCLAVKQEVFRPPVEEHKELPPWMECEKQESKCSDDLTQILSCRNNKWEVRQVCSSDAICLDRYGCILKEEFKKESSPENYAKMISSQNKQQEKEELKEEAIKDLTVEPVQNQITGGVVKNTIRNEDSLENLLKELKKLLLAILS
ncbi:hypothetical protein HZA97_02710 [Candidatus Woesearchaeota archaeon]|nr:hypothetical protein [Candidatus Woesearchaeota archaeon]